MECITPTLNAFITSLAWLRNLNNFVVFLSMFTDMHKSGKLATARGSYYVQAYLPLLRSTMKPQNCMEHEEYNLKLILHQNQLQRP